MKSKKAIFIIAILILCAGFIFGGLFAGYKLGANSTDTGDDTRYEPLDVRTIAVVNLDEGISQDGKIINYANELIDYSNENLVSTGLEDARSGVESGKYAAYVIIPAAFSENVNSINGQPVKSEIQYELYPDLTSEAGLTVMSNIYLLVENLNNNVSYMYVDSILSEFHIAQDDVEEVLNNGKAISDAVDNITAGDISADVKLPSEKKMDYSPATVDYGEYLKKNSDLIADIDKEYSDGYSKSIKEKEALDESADTLKKDISATNNMLKNVDVEVDSEGNYVYDTELTGLSSRLTDYNTELNNTVGEMTAGVSDIGTDLEGYASQLETLNGYYVDTVDKYNMDLTGSINSASDELSSGNYVSGLDREDLNENRTAGTIVDSVEIRYSGGQTRSYTLVDVDGNLNIDTLYELLEDMVNMNQVKYKTASGIDITDKSSITGILSGKISPIDINKAYHKDATGTYNSLENSLSLEIDKIKNGLDQLKVKTDEFESSPVAGIDTDSIVEDVKENVINKLSENAKNISNSISSEYEKESATLSEFSNQLGLYDPNSYINRDVIQQKNSELSASTSVLGTAIGNKDAADVEAMNDIYTKYGENIMMFKESINSAVDSSNSAVENGLENAKNTLSRNNSRNETLLDSFSKKLLYTRNGNLGNYGIYQFIVDPCDGINVTGNLDIATRNTDLEKNNKNAGFDQGLFYTILILGVMVTVFIIILVILHGKQKKDNYNL